MFRPQMAILALIVLWLGVPSPSFAQTAESEEGAVERVGAQDVETTPSGVAMEAADKERERVLRWSATLLGRVSAIGSEENSGDVGGFFDRYDYTPDKGGPFPFELGIGEASLDFIEDDHPVLQVRFASPTSNLSFSERDPDDWFLNQRGLVLARFDGLQLDFDYHRFRTEELRVFPNTSGVGLPFTDLTQDKDRFDRTRTGFLSEMRWRPVTHLRSALSPLEKWSPEIAFRGGYESRDGTRQFRTILSPGNDWTALGQNYDQDVSQVGAGLRVTPKERFSIRLDFDHNRFRQNPSTIEDTSLPFPSIGRSVAFVPSSDRSTGKVRLQGKIGERIDLKAGFQIAQLKQTDQETPAQQTAGLDGPEILTYVANGSARLKMNDRMSSRVWVKVVHRKNDLDRTTALFNPVNGTQVDEFLRRSTRVDAGIETAARVRRGLRIALGTKLHVVDRELEFAPSGLGNRVILPEVASVDDDSLAWEIYGKARMRPVQGLMVRAELGYRGAPETGYVVELDDYVHGDLQASYTLPADWSFQRPVVVTGLVRGGEGKNRDFDVTGGLGPNPPGPELDRKFDQSHWTTGLSVDASPRDDLTLSGSFFFRRDEQTSDLALSSLQRYFQEVVPIVFRSSGDLTLQTDELSLFLGGQWAVGPKTDLGLSYSYVRATSDYGENDRSPELDLVDSNRQVDAQIHGMNFSVRHRIRPGLRTQVGYTFQRYDDSAPVTPSAGSVITPFDRSTNRHTVTFGVTLDSEFFADR